MAIGIDPTVDYAFKLLLGSPEHPAITLHFLNAVLGDQFDITDVEIINPILGKEDDADKLSILDVAATDSTGRRYDIEMQTSCLLYTSPSPRDLSTSRMPSSA